MKLKFFLNVLMLSFAVATHSFSMDVTASVLDSTSTESDSDRDVVKTSSVVKAAVSPTSSLKGEKAALKLKPIHIMSEDEVCPGANIIQGHYTTRRNDFNTGPAKNDETLASTTAIIKHLSNPKMLARRLANTAAKEKMVKAVMATSFIHGGQQKLSIPVLGEGDYRCAHYLVLGQIEALSGILSTGLLGESNNQLDEAILDAQWSAYAEIETLAKIEKETFALWFNAALAEHNEGLFAKANFVKEESERLLREENVKRERAKQGQVLADTLHTLGDGSAVKSSVERQLFPLTPLESATPESKSQSGADLRQTMSAFKSPGTAVAPHSEGEVLSIMHAAKELKFTFHEVNQNNIAEVFGMSTDYFNEVSSALLESASDAGTSSCSAQDQKIEAFKNAMIAEIQTAGEDAKSFELGAAKEYIEAFLAELCINKGKIILASSCLPDVPMCVWEKEGGAYVLRAIYQKGQSLVQTPPANSKGKKKETASEGILGLITSKPETLTHFCLFKGNYYSLTLEKETILSKISAENTSKKNTYFTYKNFRSGLFIGGLSVFGVAAAGKFIPGVSSALSAGVSPAFSTIVSSAFSAGMYSLGASLVSVFTKALTSVKLKN
ncbi:MAG: hypothetical protein V4482_01430 [Pseudomonadota bacterium]